MGSGLQGPLHEREEVGVGRGWFPAPQQLWGGGGRYCFLPGTGLWGCCLRDPGRGQEQEWLTVSRQALPVPDLSVHHTHTHRHSLSCKTKACPLSSSAAQSEALTTSGCLWPVPRSPRGPERPGKGPGRRPAVGQAPSLPLGQGHCRGLPAPRRLPYECASFPARGWRDLEGTGSALTGSAGSVLTSEGHRTDHHHTGRFPPTVGCPRERGVPGWGGVFLWEGEGTPGPSEWGGARGDLVARLPSVTFLPLVEATLYCSHFGLVSKVAAN